LSNDASSQDITLHVRQAPRQPDPEAEARPLSRYDLTYNVREGAPLDDPTTPTFYTGTSKREAATVITLRPGEKLDDLTFRIGERRAIVKFVVQAVSDENFPLAGAQITNFRTNAFSATPSFRCQDPRRTHPVKRH